MLAVGYTPLQFVCGGGSLFVVKSLMRHIADRGLVITEEQLHCSLWNACQYGQPKLVRALLLAGADLSHSRGH